MNNLSGQTAVVTGGTSGIGRAIAISLARAGANVTIASRNPKGRPGGYDEGGDQPVAEFLQAEGHNAVFVATDVSSRDQVDALAKKTVDAFGSIDIWVNNAGVMPPLRPFCEYSEDELDWLLATNTKGTWHGIRAAARQMKLQGRGGSIVNVLSTAAIRPHSNQSIYNISKAAARQATQCAALEFGRDAIRVNGVCPTLVKTAATRMLVESEPFREWFGSITALGEAVDASQVAAAVLFLAGDGARNITGTMLPVDSGEALGPPAAELPG